MSEREVRTDRDSLGEVEVPREALYGPQTQRAAVNFQFSEDVSSILHPSFLTVTNLTTNEVIPYSNIAVAYDFGTNTATFTFPGYPNGVLPDGNYHFDLSAGLQDLFGNVVADTTPLDDFVLAGDANRDRSVDIGDLAILATNWQASLPAAAPALGTGIRKVATTRVADGILD